MVRAMQAAAIPIGFIAASLSLLAIPGPTNALLAMSGAATGVRRSLVLLVASVAGYLAAIIILRALVGPFAVATPAFAIALRVAIAAYLLHLAVKLWRHGSHEANASGPIDATRIFVTTLLNPKAIVFAFVLLPEQADTTALMPRLAALVLLICATGSAWIAAGAFMRRSFYGPAATGTAYRAGAIVMVLLAGMTCASAFSMV